MGARQVQVDIKNPPPLVQEEWHEIVLLVGATSRAAEPRAGADVHQASAIDVDGVGGGRCGHRVVPRRLRRPTLELLFHRHHSPAHTRFDARWLVIITITDSIHCQNRRIRSGWMKIQPVEGHHVNVARWFCIGVGN